MLELHTTDIDTATEEAKRLVQKVDPKTKKLVYLVKAEKTDIDNLFRKIDDAATLSKGDVPDFWKRVRENIIEYNLSYLGKDSVQNTMHTSAEPYAKTLMNQVILPCKGMKEDPVAHAAIVEFQKKHGQAGFKVGEDKLEMTAEVILKIVLAHFKANAYADCAKSIKELLGRTTCMHKYAVWGDVRHLALGIALLICTPFPIKKVSVKRTDDSGNRVTENVERPIPAAERGTLVLGQVQEIVEMESYNSILEMKKKDDNRRKNAKRSAAREGAADGKVKMPPTTVYTAHKGMKDALEDMGIETQAAEQFRAKTIDQAIMTQFISIAINAGKTRKEAEEALAKAVARIIEAKAGSSSGTAPAAKRTKVNDKGKGPKAGTGSSSSTNAGAPRLPERKLEEKKAPTAARPSKKVPTDEERAAMRAAAEDRAAREKAKADEKAAAEEQVKNPLESDDEDEADGKRKRKNPLGPDDEEAAQTLTQLSLGSRLDQEMQDEESGNEGKGEESGNKRKREESDNEGKGDGDETEDPNEGKGEESDDEFDSSSSSDSEDDK